MQDQRGPRVLVRTLTDRSMSLRTADVLVVTDTELEARQEERLESEKKAREAERKRVCKEKSDRETETLFAKVSHESIDWGDIDAEVWENNSLSEEESDKDSDTESESDWEDFDEVERTPEYNTLKLKNFSRECDRYKASNREAAKLANALLKDLKIVTKKDSSKLLCPGKIRRERLKWGGELEKSHSAQLMPGGLYSDGKKCPTLVRDTTSVAVQVC